MKIAISAESTIDLPKEILEQYDIHIIPFHVLLGEKMGLDGEITPSNIFDYVDETGVLPKTAAVNNFEYDEYFAKLLNDYDAVIHISLSEKISSAINNARQVARELKNVYVIDSKSLSTGIALSSIYARKLADQGIEPKEIVKKVEKRIDHLQVSFVVNTLSYLYKGGRCTGLQRFGALLLRLKPQIVLRDGAMVPGKKYRGKTLDCVASYCNDTLEEFNNPDKSLVFITHTYATEDMIETCRKALIEKGFKNILVTTAGATITSHCGPKTIGILYINDGGIE